MVIFHLLKLEGMPIFEQLQIEEALVRADDRNWIVVNQGSPPAIVMGISGKEALHVRKERMSASPIPLIRRFSGGGTVVVDEKTHFFTLIGNRSLLDFPCYPEKLMLWTEELYAPAFSGVDFSLRDHDYVIANRKFGGNAQYISKERFLHHSSLLWDFNEHMMEYLLMPPKMPAYREARSHMAFLCKLKDFFSTPESFQRGMIETLAKRFRLVPVTLSSLAPIFERDYRRFTRIE